MYLAIIALIASAAIVLYLVWSRRQQRRFERSVQEPLGRLLDGWIAEIEHPDVPIEDIYRYDRRGDDGSPIEAGFYVYLASGGGIDVVCRYRRGKMEYSIKHGARPALTEGPFPPYDAPACHQPWFVQRMAKLFALLDAYPRERLRSVQAQRIIEQERSDLSTLDDDAFIEECERRLAAGELP